MKKVSIIIPTLNEEENIGHLLNDLYRDRKFIREIIVIDGNSEDKTQKVVRHHKAKAKLLSHKRLVSAQRNKGASTAASEILIFFDADVRIPKDFIKHTIDIFTRDDLDVACPVYVPYKTNFYIRFLYYFFINGSIILTQKLSPSGGGPCIIVRKEHFDRFGGFREDLKFDDIELIQRLGKKGRFAVILKKIYVSDRRFKKTGATKLIILYGILSILFTLRLHKIANYFPYRFGDYKK